MKQISELLEFAKRTALSAGKTLLKSKSNSSRKITGRQISGKEIKIAADIALNKLLQTKLKITGIPILSEESFCISKTRRTDLLWIIDPLDGSVNYLRNLGPSMISIALWKGSSPIFGVLHDVRSGSLAWGGLGLGAWENGSCIHVSTCSRRKDGVLLTGIPARFPDKKLDKKRHFSKILFSFNKVRMIGSAAASLLLVAKGAGDAYAEDSIMLWDVAAGLAIVEGAGGGFKIDQTRAFKPCRVLSANKILLSNVADIMS